MVRLQSWLVIVLVCALGLVCAACGEDEQSPEQAEVPGLSDPPVDYPVPDARPPVTTCVAPAMPPPPGRIALERAFSHAFPSGAHLDRAIEMVQSTADPSRWYLALQHGQVLTFTDDPEGGGHQVAVDIRDKLWLEHHETGLVSLALHPDFANNRHLFLSYSVPTEANFASRVARFTVSQDGTRVDPDSEHVIIDVEQPHGSHSGNQIAFGPDGYLYFALGDGQNPNDRHRNGQNPNTLYASILRLDVDRADPEAGRPYSVPTDNPFADGQGGAPEVYAYGLRNVWRFSFDQDTGDLWAGDVGQDTREEVNLIQAGANYGWPLKEGFYCFELDEPCQDTPGLTDPVVDYTHSEGRSITGGVVYRGDAIPALRGRYLYADFVNGSIWVLDQDQSGAALPSLELESGINIPSFAQDKDGEVYVLRYDTEGEGGVFKVVAAPEGGEDQFPALLSETGCVDMEDPARPYGGAIPYLPSSRLWSDGAEKDQFAVIPPQRRLEVSPEGDFLFPVGTVLIKNFKYEGRYHETRLLIRHEEAWAGYSYEWNDEQTDARLLEAGRTRELPNGVRWVYPTRGQCMECHSAVARRALGPEAAQLDHELVFVDQDNPEGVSANQLARWFDYGMFHPDLEALEDIPKPVVLPEPFGDAPLQDRARSYLHANCAGCHQPDGPGRGELDLRYTTPFSESGLCDGEPKESSTLYLGRGDLKLLQPGAPEDSIVYLRMVSVNLFRMPPLATHIVDEQGTSLIFDWIEDLEECP